MGEIQLNLPGFEAQVDLPVPEHRKTKARRDWGLENVVGIEAGNASKHQTTLIAAHNDNARRQHLVRSKIATFLRTAIYPQQLTIPRQYATTEPGCRIYKVMEDREVDRVAGGGTRVVVQENMQQARFIMSPLFRHRIDAVNWAVRNTGAEVPKGLI